MERSRRRGFTLIEVLLVISIIVLLMTLLVPAIGATIRAVKIANAERVIQTLHKAVVEYYRVFGAYPPDTSPDKNMDTSKDGAYLPYHFADGTVDGTLVGKNQQGIDIPHPPIFNDGNWLGRCYGGKFLVYFLMGPYGQGWHRPKTTEASDPLYRHRFLTAEWDPPAALSSILANRPVEQGSPGALNVASSATTTDAKTFAVFLDGFGLEGSNGGTIGYIKASLFPGTPSATDNGRWTEHNGAMHSAMYSDCRYGDGLFIDHLTKMLAQCPDNLGFALISPGPDRKFGYRVPVMLIDGEYRKGSWAKLDTGLIDDIANFPLK